METTKIFRIDDDLLSDLPFEAKLAALHRKLRDELGCHALGRISVASYEGETGLLAVYAFSDLDGQPLRLYSAPLKSVPSLSDLAESGKARIIRDMFDLGPVVGPHTVALRRNYRSSLTIPLRKGPEFYGFIFFNSDEPDYFKPELMERLLPYGNLLAAITVADLDRIKTLKAAVQTTRDISNLRDDETAGHLHRMAAYARLIAVGLAPQHGLSERWIDMLVHFAPLHDVGKIGVPDSILFKAGKLSADEFEIMRSHVGIGNHVVEALLSNFGIGDHLFASMLTNIVACHHESMDGSGYPLGLTGNTIPLEARITSTADIFDALTSKRPYKDAWTNDEAMRHLCSIAGTKLDADCVAILNGSKDQILDIQKRFRNGDELVDDRTMRPFSVPVLALE